MNCRGTFHSKYPNPLIGLGYFSVYLLSQTILESYKMKHYYTLLFLFLLPFTLFGQELIKKDTTTRKATIEFKTNNNELLLTPIVPPLRQIAGAPKAYYSYFWELGDGNYSKKEKPKHTYKKKGDYEVKLWVTNHYDTGKPPATRPQKVSVNDVSANAEDVIAMTDDLELQINRDPIPDQEMVMVMSYKNKKEYVTNGRLYLFYNEKKYANDNFELSDFRLYNNEEEVDEPQQDVVYTKDINSSESLYASLDDFFDENQQLQDSTRTDLKKTLEDSKSYYKSWKIFDFDEMNPSEERNMFFTFKTTPEMLKDTSAIISIRGVYVPDRNFKNHKVKEKEMEIVTSHDPNKMSSNGTILNYRFVRFKTLKYKIQFQNDGEGPAKTIRLETDIPKMLDKSTIKVLDMYPKCEICPKEEVEYSCLDTTYTDKQAVFTFKNIYLPGSNQKNVHERDSTKGFVKYSIKFGDDFHKKKTRSQTAIIFDKNEPIITNISTTRFLPGISIGAKTGYNSFTNLDNSRSYFVGATLSPYKSYRWYWQVELMNNFHSYNTTSVDEKFFGQPGADVREITRIKTTSSYSNVDWDIPVLIRYNVNNYIGLGAGVQGTISVTEKNERTTLTEMFMRVNQIDTLISSSETEDVFKNSFTNLRKGFLLEVTGGFARIGPSLGARYVINTDSNYNHWQFYAIWKF